LRCFALPLILLTALTACGGHYRPVSDVPVRIGAPYKVRGLTYTPAAQPDYDMLGYASWYGGESGNRVANGERFRPKWITGAHTTVPLLGVAQSLVVAWLSGLPCACLTIFPV
jgi:rare lipoprotein A